jgi:predicted metal-binding membrane protein
VGERAHGADAAERVEEPVVGFTWPIYGLPEEKSLRLMAMLVTLGVMSITWMAVMAVLVLAQKLLPAKTAIDLPLFARLRRAWGHDRHHALPGS